MSATSHKRGGPLSPYPPAPELPRAIDRRAFLLRNAVIGAAALTSSGIAMSAAHAEQAAKGATPKSPTPIIFPMLDGTWAYANLGKWAEADWGKMPEGSASPWLDPKVCGNWIAEIARSLGADRVWGGYGEERKTLWKGCYKDAPVVIHLGLDFNGLPPGCPIAVPREIRVIDSWGDPSEHNGWGGRLIMETTTRWHGTRYLLYGHLDPRLLPRAGEVFRAGEIVGVIAPSRFNGGWDPHLHVQLVGDQLFNEYRGQLQELDGYYLKPDELYRQLAPDPTELVVR